MFSSSSGVGIFERSALSDKILPISIASILYFVSLLDVDIGLSPISRRMISPLVAALFEFLACLSRCCENAVIGVSNSAFSRPLSRAYYIDCLRVLSECDLVPNSPLAFSVPIYKPFSSYASTVLMSSGFTSKVSLCPR